MRGIQTHQKLIETCITMRQQGKSLNEICKTVGLSKSTVFAYIKTVHISPHQKEQLKQNTIDATIRNNRSRRGIAKIHHSIKSPPWSATFIYHVSHFFFDGSLCHHQVSYYNRSSTLIENQKQAVYKLFGIQGKVILRPNGVYKLWYSSVDFARQIESYRNQIVSVISHAPEIWKINFLKSFFDDEGNVYMSKDHKFRRVRGYQYDISILYLIQCLLAELTIQGRIDLTAKCVDIRGRENLIKFAELINFSPGLTINPERKNSIYSKPYEKRELLRRALESYKR